MSYLDVFKRYELKYILTSKQKEQLLLAMDGHMRLDDYGKTTIRNIYYDTSDMRLVRNSLDKPDYKEKLRVRSYRQVKEQDDVFVEIKKKYDGIVYKRRLALPECEASAWLSGQIPKPVSSQIANEIDYMLSYYGGLSPACFLSYEREAYFDVTGRDLRITTDSNILARNRNMSLRYAVSGDRILPQGLTVLEVKTSGALPLWLVEFFSENRIYKDTFSKYGTYYREHLFDEINKNTHTKGYLLYA